MSVLPDRFLNKKHPHSTANATSYVSRQVPLNVQEAPASTTFNFRIGTVNLNKPIRGLHPNW